MRLASNWIVTSLDLVGFLIRGLHQLRAGVSRGSGGWSGKDAALGGALRHAVERNEPGNQFPDFGGRLLHNRKVARQLLPNCGSRRFDDGCA